MKRSAWILTLLAANLAAHPLSAQTITGLLLDAENQRPIELGIVVLLTEEGDTVDVAPTYPAGRFSITAPEPGSFLLRSSAFGYAEREDGVFELGSGGEMSLEIRIAPRPLELEGIVATTEQPTFDHPLVKNGFVDRYQRGFGYFVTPHDLERTVYRDTESLFYFVPRVRVLTSSLSTGSRGARLGPATDRISMRNFFGPGWCTPNVFIDGRRTLYRPSTGETLDLMAPIGALEGVEVYRSPAEIPGQFQGGDPECGVIVIWLKH